MASKRAGRRSGNSPAGRSHLDSGAVRGKVRSGSVSLACYRWLPAASNRPKIVLVHGYPDNASVWTPVADFLSRDFNVLAYDVRGAGRSTRPNRTRDYVMSKLNGDLEAVLNAFSPDEPVHLVGHDWGSIQSWAAVTDPGIAPRIASFTSISGPGIDQAGHWIRERMQGRTREDLRSVAGQLARSWYIAAFQIPGFGETLWRVGAGRLWPKLLSHMERVEDPTPIADRALDGRFGVRMYRANFLKRLLRPAPQTLRAPLQLIVPTRERFIHPQLFDALEDWAPSFERHDIDGGHWLPLSHPEELAKRIAAFVSRIERSGLTRTPHPETEHAA